MAARITIFEKDESTAALALLIDETDNTAILGFAAGKKRNASYPGIASSIGSVSACRR